MDTRRTLALSLLAQAGFCALAAQLARMLVELGGARRESLMLVLGCVLAALGLGFLTHARGRLRSWWPSAGAQVSLAFVVLACAWVALAWGIEWGFATSSVGAGARQLALLGLAGALACLGPASHELVETLEPRTGASWRLAWLPVLGGGWALGSLSGPSGAALAECFAVCVRLGACCVGVGVALAFTWAAVQQQQDRRRTGARAGLGAASMLGPWPTSPSPRATSSAPGAGLR